MKKTENARIFIDYSSIVYVESSSSSFIYFLLFASDRVDNQTSGNTFFNKHLTLNISALLNLARLRRAERIDGKKDVWSVFKR